MQDNSKQEEGFFSLMFQFGIMLFVFWLICFFLEPLFPESKEYGEYDENGKRNFQYACNYRNISEDEINSLVGEILTGEELTEASYDVERFVNDVYSMMVPVYNRYLDKQITVEKIEVKQYDFFADTNAIVGEEIDENVLILSDSIKNSREISEETNFEILIALTEIYSKKINSQTIGQPLFGNYEEKEFGPGIKRLVYEDMVNFYLEKDPNPISFFIKNQVPEFQIRVLEGGYEYLENEYEEAILAKANLRGWYTAIEALELHLEEYYKEDNNEYAFICCLELALMPGMLEENGIKEEEAEQIIEKNVDEEHQAYLSRLI